MSSLPTSAVPFSWYRVEVSESPPGICALTAAGLPARGRRNLHVHMRQRPHEHGELAACSPCASEDSEVLGLKGRSRGLEAR